MPNYKIRAKDADHLSVVKRMAEQETEVYVTSVKRLYLSTGDLPGDVKDAITATGAKVTPEYTYDMDASSGPSFG